MTIAEIEKKSIPILRSYGVRRASIFGSNARGDARGDSDVDFLISLGRPMGLISYTRLINELQQSLERPVDVVTEDALNQHLRPFVMRDVKIIYEE